MTAVAKPHSSACRHAVAKLIHSKIFAQVIIGLILFNAVTLGLETNADIMARHGVLLHLIDRAVIWVFVVELTLRIYVHRLSFFRGGWNLFDFIIVGVSLVPHIGPFAVLRTLRVLRVFRLISTVPSMRKVVSAMVTAIPGMASVLSILLVVFYVASVLITQVLSRVTDPEVHDMFGSIGLSMRTLFQVMTLDNWMSEVVLPVSKYFPYATPFFVLFVIVTSFAVLNLFIGIIVDAMNVLRDGEHESAEKEQMRLLRQIEADVARLNARLEDKSRD